MLCSDLLSSFPQDFLLLPRSGVLRGSCLLFFFFEVFLSAFEISFSSRPFLFFGGEVWLGPYVFGPAWVLWTLLLALGRFVLLSLPGPLAVQLRFFLCMWFRQNLEVSSLRRSLWWSAGCSVPGTFYWCCGILSLPYRSLWALGEVFYSVFFPLLAGSFLRPFLDSWLRLVFSL